MREIVYAFYIPQNKEVNFLGSVQRYERLDSWMLVGCAVTDADGFLRDSPIVARTGIYIYINSQTGLLYESTGRRRKYSTLTVKQALSASLLW